MNRFVFIIALLFTSFIVNAQKFTSFSSDPSLTPQEMKAFIETAPKEKKKEGELLLAKFTAFWTNPETEASFQRDFIEISNLMLRKNFKVFPQFESYVNAFNAFITSDLKKSRIDWLKIIQYHVDKDAASFHNKMDNYAEIFTDNILTSRANSRWVSSGKMVKMGIKEEPFFEFANITLTGASKQDSLQIENTSGTYYPSSLKWEGKKGEVFWHRAGMSDKVKAELSNYEINMRQPKFTAENVLLHYPDYFSFPLKGVLEDKAGLETTEEKATYPRFRSYNNNLTIKNIYKNVDYVGGFELRGSSIMGSATGDELARVVISKNGKRIVSVRSRSFLLKKDAVHGLEANVSIYVENDSIYHPAADFKFSEKNNELLLSRQKNGIGRTPFFDSYHKVDITVETISWLIDTETIEFKPMQGSTNASSAFFESQNYFESSKMRKIQGYNEVNPLYQLWGLFRSNSYKDLPFKEVVNYFNRSPEDVRTFLIELAAYGFIEYDIYKDEIHYRSKIAQYLNNNVGKKDYDNIILESKTHYAALSLLNNELRISGCEFFVLSDTQIVNVYPQKGNVIMKKNRNMTFSGKVIAGLFDFNAQNCEFNYDKFIVDMQVVDSMVMYVEDKSSRQNMYGEHALVKVQSTIEDLSGTLYIDVPENKCGRVDYPDYSYFEGKGGKVYYDKPITLKGDYKRDRFYFLVDPFKIKNLSNFNTDSIEYNGTLVSGGIFPDIRQPLKVRPDFSLGFVHRTSESGLSAYGGKGTFSNIIDLSNKGLRGKGTINYLTSVTQSDSLVFYLDSVNGSIRTHVVNEQLAGTEFPPANVKNARLHWEPYQDQMFVHTQKTSMSIFNETELTGYSKLTPSGMFGKGVVKLKKADLSSNLFSFKHHELFADTANMRIYGVNPDEFVFITDNYNSHIDFQTRKGHFVSNGDVSEIFFVKNEYKTKSSAFDWDPIDEDVITIKWDDPYKNVDINNTPAGELVEMISEGNELVATNPGQRGMMFNAVNAEFNFTKNIIKANGVRFMDVADAAIIPYDGKVEIFEKGQLGVLERARILAGKENKFHELYNCRAEIRHREDFVGNGYYDFIDENKMVQTLHFDTVWVYKTTKGYAPIPKEMDFKFSPHFGFDGKAMLNSEEEFLTFIGGVEFIHDCDTVKHARLRISAPVNPNDILIEVHDRSKDTQDRKVVNAIASANKTGRIYTSFGTAKDEFNDAEYISVFGYITYDKETQEFKVASLEKLKNPALPENIITLSKVDCISKGTGNIDMGAKLGRVEFNTNGTIINYMMADSAVMELMTSINFYFSEEAMKLMTKQLESSSSLNFVDMSNDDSYETALMYVLGKEDYNRYQRETALTGQAKKLPQKLQVQFLFSNINFIWDKANTSFVSQPELPLIICGSKQVNKMVPGRVIIEKRGSRNRLYLYFEVDNDYYYFKFENNSMYGFSSDKQFNDAITAVKSSKRNLPASKGIPSFTFKLGNRSDKNKFVKKYYTLEQESTDD